MTDTVQTTAPDTCCSGHCSLAETAPASDTAPGRRTLLRGAATAGALAAAAPLLAACSSSTSKPVAAATTGAPAGGGAPSPTTAAGAGSSSPTASASLGDVASIPVGGGKIFADQQVVVTQPTAGQFKGFSSTCTHMGCTVGQVSGGAIMCPCHGSQFNIADGSVKQGPAAKPLPPVNISVQGTQIVLAG